QGVVAKLSSGASLRIPAGAVRDASGKSVSGKVTLALAEFDGHKHSQASALPGDGSARAKDGTAGRATLEDALDIRIFDDKGASYTVGPADKVVAELPVRKADAGAL